jgi:hypothetical protein
MKTMPRTDLFVRLAKYRPTHARESFENFFTELVGHLLEEEPSVGQDFAECLLRGSARNPRIQSVKVTTQVPTQSHQARLSGLFLDLVLEVYDGMQMIEVIVENKVGAKLTGAQLDNYLAYAEERRDRRVAVVTRRENPIASQCNHPSFLGEFRWGEVAERWKHLPDVSNRYLLNGVLNLMRSKRMGPFEPFTTEDRSVFPRWSAFKRKIAAFAVEEEALGSKISTARLRVPIVPRAPQQASVGPSWPRRRRRPAVREPGEAPRGRHSAVR